MADSPSILAVDEDVRMLRDSARSFLAAEWPAEQAVARSQDPASLRRIWKAMGAQGWLGLGADRDAGGLRFLTVLLEELGRAGCPAPLFDAFLAGLLLSPVASARPLLEAIEAGDASVSIVFGAGTLRFEDTAVWGRASFVEGASIATHFLVLGADAIGIVEAPAVRTTPTPGLSVPPLSDVELDRAPARVERCAASVLEDAPRLARLALATRALGAASRGFDLIVDYAKVRTQFGRKIGQFQAIQHKLANALVQLETSRLTLWRAASAYDRRDPQWTYACGAAVSLASPALRQVCLETHHAFGGVSFWEEHEMPRHFRRIHADLVRCGGVYAAREDVARSLLDGAH